MNYNIKDKIETLIKAINLSESKFAEDDKKSIEVMVNSCANYLDKVTAMEVAMQVRRFQLEPEEYREMVQRLDKKRKSAHDAMIVNINICNRLANMYKVPEIYSGGQDRSEYATFAKNIVVEYFDKRKK